MNLLSKAGCFAALLLTGLTFLFGVGQPKTFTVCEAGHFREGCDYEFVQEAINAARPQDTLVITAGTYEGNFIVDKTLQLIAIGTVLVRAPKPQDERYSPKPAFAIRADGVEIDGFIITNGDAGISVEKAKKTRITNNTFRNNWTGIELEDTQEGLVQANAMENNAIGLRGWSAERTLIRDNTVKSNYWGLTLSGPLDMKTLGENLVQNNTISGNSVGLHMCYSFHNRILGNQIAGNRLQGIALYNGLENQLIGNTVRDNGTGIALGDSDSNRISSNGLQGNALDGLLAYDSSDNLFRKNHIESNGRIGINLLNASGNLLEHNVISDNRSGGIVEQLSQDNSFKDNREQGNGSFSWPEDLTCAQLSEAPSRGGKIVFSRGEGRAQEIYVVDTSTEQLLRITNNASWDGEAAWSADGESLAFLRANPDEKADELWVVKFPSLEAQLILTQPWSGEWAPMGITDMTNLGWSNDGEWLLFETSGSVTSHRIWRVGKDGSDPEVIQGGYDLEMLDNGQLKVFSHTYIRSTGSDELYIIDSQGQEIYHWGELHNLWPVISPRGSRALFSGSSRGYRGFEEGLYLMDLVSGRLEELINQTDRMMYQVTASDGDTHRQSDTAWSPCECRFLFVSDRDGDREIYLFDIRTKEEHKLTDNEAHDYGPVWSPDGQRIAFVSERDGNPEIYTMNADGSDEIRITDHPLADLCPEWSP